MNETGQRLNSRMLYSVDIKWAFCSLCPDVETMCFIFTFLACGPYIFWIGQGVYNISGKCCGLVPFK